MSDSVNGLSETDIEELHSLVARLKEAKLPVDKFQTVEAEDGSEVAVVIPDGALAPNGDLEDVDVLIVPSSQYWDANLLIELFLSIPYYLDKFEQSQRTNMTEVDRITGALGSLIVYLELSSGAKSNPQLATFASMMAVLLKNVLNPQDGQI